MKIKKEIMREMAYSGDKLEDKIIENTRWSVVHEMVFPFEGKFYQSVYSVGATESQDESAYEYADDEIEVTEVHQVEKTVKVWEEKK